MQIIKQNFFDEFKCIAEKCPESCCKGWKIAIDTESLKRYRALGKKDPIINKGIDYMRESFRQFNDKCVFLDKDSLCFIQKNYGEELLCDTCRSYPRHCEEFENIREYSLTLSCPHAAELLLKTNAPMEFSFEENDDKDDDFEDFDAQLFDILKQTRLLLFNIAKNRGLSVKTRFKAILNLSLDLQEMYDDGHAEDFKALLDKYNNDPNNFSYTSGTHEPDFDWESEKRIFSVLFDLEPIHKDWDATVSRTWDFLFSGNTEDISALYGFCPNRKELRADFEKYLEDNAVKCEQLLMFFLYTYFLGAIYDEWIYSKAALCVYSTKWILLNAFANDTSSDSITKAAYIYAKQVEHSDENLDILEEWFYEL